MERGGYIEREPTPEEEREQCALEILELLARVVEKGPELDPMVKKNIRARIQQKLLALGIKNIDDPLLLELVSQAHRRRDSIVTGLPESYPRKDDFVARYRKILQEPPQGTLEPCNHNPELEEVLENAYTEWETVKGRGSLDTEEYLYELGKVLSNRNVYEILFPENDAIAVNPDWSVENGRHRVFALKCLGSPYIRRKGMRDWVEVALEK